MPAGEMKESGFKQRLVGAIVLVSLAVIFLPMLFDEPHSDRMTREIEVPADPDLPEIRVGAPQHPAPLEITSPAAPQEGSAVTGEAPAGEGEMGEIPDAPPVAGEPVELAPTTAQEQVPVARPEPAPVKPVPAPSPVEATTPVEQPKVVEKPKPAPVAAGGFMVQLGSFGNRDNALALRDKAASAGYQAHADDVTVNGKRVTRVWVGPFASRTEAEKAKPKVDSVTKMTSRVLAR